MAPLRNVQAILLSTDFYSPMSAPHALPALYWPSLAKDFIDDTRGGGADMIEQRLRQGGWDPQWRFGMYKQAHYHSVSMSTNRSSGHANCLLGDK